MLARIRGRLPNQTSKDKNLEDGNCNVSRNVGKPLKL
jgi:hypothetical protein